MSPVTKDELRRAIRMARRARAPQERGEAGAAIADHAEPYLDRTAGAFTTFMSMPTEPPTDELNARLLATGARVLVPRIVGSDLHWVELRQDSELGLGAMGIREPKGHDVPLAGVRTMFIPALAIGPSGERLGQGGGFYDRTLGRLPRVAEGGPLRIAVTFADEVRDWLPTEWFDAQVDLVLTPGGLWNCDGTPAQAPMPRQQ